MTRARAVRAACMCATAVLVLAYAGAAHALTAAEGRKQLAAIETRWQALSTAPRRDQKALAELERRAASLAADASRALATLREDAAERDADMASVVAGAEWQGLETLLLELRFRIAWIELERALVADRGAPERARLARSAAEGFATFVDAPDPVLSAESRYGRGLARLAAGERAAGLDDLRAAAAQPKVAPRARLALASALAEGGERKQALDVLAREIASGRLAPDRARRAKLLRLELLVATVAAGSPESGEIAALAIELLAAGEPYRAAALAALRGHEDLLPAGDDADPAVLRLRAQAAARAGDAARALELHRALVARAGEDVQPGDLEGLARAAYASEEWDEARGAVAHLRAGGAAPSREMALVELRAAYAAWQASRDDATAAALEGAAARAADAKDATADDRAEAAFRTAELARAADDLARACAGFAAIDAAAWQAAAGTAALQCRVTRHAREPQAEPRDALLRDLAAWLARPGLPDDARATAVVLDATLRTLPGDPGALDRAEQRAALARLRELPQRHAAAGHLLPAVLRARALLELELGETPDVALLGALPAAERSAVAAAIAADLRDAVGGAATADDAEARERARRGVSAALAFAALAPADERAQGRVDLAQAALAAGDVATAERLFREEAGAQPASLRALRGLALVAEARGDPAAARAAWQRLAALPDLPPAVREEAELGATTGARRAPAAR